MPRSRLGPLAIESKLGDQPSQGSVWRAIHVQQKQSLAVKVFSVPFGGTPESREQFAAEWTALKQLQHPAIARCYGGGFEAGDAYLAYELIDGETLASQVDRRTRLPWENVLELAEPLIEALDYLHQNDVVYGMLQPDKIMIAGLSPVLIDVRTSRFGSAFQSNRPPTAAELRIMSPEAAADTTSLTPASDLYALGAILYLAITGSPPIDGNTVEEVMGNLKFQTPVAPAKIILDCPVWLDKLVMQLLEKAPEARPYGAGAVKLALAEVRKRSMSRSGVAEHASSGFSPLSVTDQKDRDEARSLLGRDLIEAAQKETKQPVDASEWYENSWFLVIALVALLSVIAYFAWPLNEDGMRSRAEAMIEQQTRSAMTQARISYLEPMLRKYPEGEHAEWAAEQIDQILMIEAEHALTIKLKNNLKLKNEAERLYAEALDYERFGDKATALDKYRSMVTLLDGEDDYRPFVNLARRQISVIESSDNTQDEAYRIIEAKLEQAEQALADGDVVLARKIWYSVVDLYATNANLAPLVARAQDRLSQSQQDVRERSEVPRASTSRTGSSQ
ncbi:MAG: serine/threonine-protein kinase [Planctomycetota bacterium]